MKTPDIISPVKTIKDFDSVIKTGCKKVYVYHKPYQDEKGLKALIEMINKAKELNLEFYIKFKGNIKESDIKKTKNFMEFIENTPINGILINSLDILEFIKNKKLPFKIFIDSGLNLHNLAGIEFVGLFNSIDNYNITEEIYIKNLAKIRKYTKKSLSIDSDNLSWIAEEIIKSKTVDIILIKGDFESPKKLLDGILLVEKILEDPKSYKNKKLPFKNPDHNYYRSNHFSCEFLSSTGKDFKFTGNIQQFNWKFNRTKLTKSIATKNIPALTLRLTGLEQINSLKGYIKKLKFNPVYAVEYGEILSTADLSRQSFNKIIEKVKKECFDLGIKLQLSTPRILNERDFDRVYEYVKLLCIQSPYPSSIVINNLGYWSAIINDTDFDKLNIELGQGLNLLNSTSISCLTNQYPVSCVDLSNLWDIEDIKLCINNIKKKIPDKKLTIAGSIRVPSLGLCPLNNDSAILSRLSCTAPCHKGNYAITDPSQGKTFPFTVDGFCRMHLFHPKILDLFNHIKYLENLGINEFVADLSGLSHELVPVLLTRFLNSVSEENYINDPDFEHDMYRIKKTTL